MVLYMECRTQGVIGIQCKSKSNLYGLRELFG